MLSGPRGGPSRGVLVPLGLELNTTVTNFSPVTGRHRRVSPGHLHWIRPQHLHRLQLPAHSCSTQITWDLMSPRRRLSCL